MSRKSVARWVTCALIGALSSAAGPASAVMSAREIYRTKGKAVVLVFATDGSAQGSAGTGSIISAEGEVITNAHVIAKDGRPYKRVFIYVKPEKLRGSMKHDLQHRYQATVVDVDHNLDLALLKIVDPPGDLATIDFVDPEEVEVGEPVVAIGHPETGGLWTLTTGTISSVVADFQGIDGKDVFQTDASVNRGNSGGPLLNAFGQMVGINTSISRRAADGLAITDINFSLKSSVAVEWLKARKLLFLAYVKPEAPAETGTAVAMAEPKPAPAPKATPPGAYQVDGGDGKTKIVVVPPKKGQEVSEDPEWLAAASGTANVSRAAAVPAKGASKKPAPQPQVKPKLLTKARPYKLDPFVNDRIQEIKAMERMMGDMEKEVDQRRGPSKATKRPKTDGMGLW